MLIKKSIRPSHRTSAFVEICRVIFLSPLLVHRQCCYAETKRRRSLQKLYLSLNNLSIEMIHFKNLTHNMNFKIPLPFDRLPVCSAGSFHKIRCYKKEHVLFLTRFAVIHLALYTFCIGGWYITEEYIIALAFFCSSVWSTLRRS